MSVGERTWGDEEREQKGIREKNEERMRRARDNLSYQTEAKASQRETCQVTATRERALLKCWHCV